MLLHTSKTVKLLDLEARGYPYAAVEFGDRAWHLD